MSGIAGILNHKDEKITERNQIEAMLLPLSKRGPDGSKTFESKNIIFGHTLLNISDGKDEILEKDKILYTSDLRLDNREYLIKKFGFNKEISEHELVIDLFRILKEDSFKELEGSFAFAIYDKLNKTLYLCRDQFGIRPLYYFCDDKRTLFASEIKAILANKYVLKEMNKERVIDFLRFLHGKPGQTFFKNILKVPSGHYLKVTDRSQELKQYYSFDLESNQKIESFDVSSQKLRALFQDSIKQNIRTSEEKVGTTLSGGIDSSSIAGMASRIIQEEYLGIEMNTYSALFKGLSKEDFDKTDEKKYMEDLLEETDAIGHYIEIDSNQVGPISDLKDSSYYFDEPVSAINGYIHKSIFRKAKSNSVKIILEGTDGDSVISHGYERIKELGKELKLAELFRVEKKLKERRGKKFSYWQSLKTHVIRNRVPKVLLNTYYDFKGIQGDFYDTWEKKLSDNLKKGHKSEDIRVIFGHNPDVFQNAKFSHFSQTFLYPWETAFELIDCYSSNYGIQVRYPFFNKSLVEYCINLPPKYKLKDGRTRSIFKKSMEGVIPESIRNREQKSDLSPIAVNNLISISKNRNLMHEILFSNKSPLTGLIDKRYIENHIVKNIEKEPSHVSQLYALISLYFWMEKNSFSWNK